MEQWEQWKYGTRNHTHECALQGDQDEQHEREPPETDDADPIGTERGPGGAVGADELGVLRTGKRAAVAQHSMTEVEAGPDAVLVAVDDKQWRQEAREAQRPIRRTAPRAIRM